MDDPTLKREQGGLGLKETGINWGKAPEKIRHFKDAKQDEEIKASLQSKQQLGRYYPYIVCSPLHPNTTFEVTNLSALLKRLSPPLPKQICVNRLLEMLGVAS